MGARDEYVKAVKAAFVTLSVEASLAFFKAKAPGLFLTLPFLDKVVRYFLEKYLELLVDHLETGLFFHYIDTRVIPQARNFENAAVENFRAQMSGSKEERDRAKKNLIDSFRPLASFTS